jgi:DNA-binding Lrp family transcriptional regulator
MRRVNTAEKHAGHAIRQVELLNYLLNNLSQFNLKPTTKLVLLYLAGCYNPKHADVFPKQKTIAHQMGISEASVIRAIQELHKEGLIISERKYTNRYKFTSRILNLGGMVEDFSEANNMQVENSQNATSETSNLQAPYIEQEKEQKKEQTEENNLESENIPQKYSNSNSLDFERIKFLKEYAQKHYKTTPQAYFNWLMKNKDAQDKIISEHKKQEKVTQMALCSIRETQELIKNYNEMSLDSNAPYTSDAWKKFSEKARLRV